MPRHSRAVLLLLPLLVGAAPAAPESASLVLLWNGARRTLALDPCTGHVDFGQLGGFSVALDASSSGGNPRFTLTTNPWALVAIGDGSPSKTPASLPIQANAPIRIELQHPGVAATTLVLILRGTALPAAARPVCIQRELDRIDGEKTSVLSQARRACGARKTRALFDAYHELSRYLESVRSKGAKTDPQKLESLTRQAADARSHVEECSAPGEDEEAAANEALGSKELARLREDLWTDCSEDPSGLMAWDKRACEAHIAARLAERAPDPLINACGAGFWASCDAFADTLLDPDRRLNEPRAAAASESKLRAAVSTAAKSVEGACAAGEARACYRAGWLYDPRGLGRSWNVDRPLIRKDAERATRFYQRACDARFADACPFAAFYRPLQKLAKECNPDGFPATDPHNGDADACQAILARCPEEKACSLDLVTGAAFMACSMTRTSEPCDLYNQMLQVAAAGTERRTHPKELWQQLCPAGHCGTFEAKAQ